MTVVRKTLSDRIRLLKACIPVEEAVSEIAGIEFKWSKSVAWPAGDDVCPCEEHRQNFRVNRLEDRAYCKTPGCNIQGDLIDFTKAYLGIGTVNAVRHLEMLFEGELQDCAEGESCEGTVSTTDAASRERRPGIPAESGGILNPSAADYQFFSGCQRIFESGLREEVAGFSYLTEQRRHSVEAIRAEGVGYTDHSLSYRIRARGNQAVLEQLTHYGLLSSSGSDVAVRGLITFPLRDREGRVCGFRFKDPAKRYMAQQLRSGILNGVTFLGEHTLKDLPRGHRVLVVEGEHDWLSLRDAGWREGLLASCGQLSRRQIEWLRRNMGEWQLVTAFDNDHGGENYREQVASELKEHVTEQYVPPGVKSDPDSFLRDGGSLTELLGEGQRWLK